MNRSSVFDDPNGPFALLLEGVDMSTTGMDGHRFNNTTLPLTTSEELEEQFLATKVIIYVLYTLIGTLGIAGNVMVCLVVARNSAMHTVTNVFIANLALSDILLCLFAVPFTPLYLISQKWTFGTLLCHLLPFAQGMYYPCFRLGTCVGF